MLDAAEKHGFDLLVTTDTRLKYQQNLSPRRIAIVVLSTPSWPRIQLALGTVASTIAAALPGSYEDVEIP